MPPKAAAAKPKKKANGYARPADVALGTVLTDTHKQSWKVGPSIGSGGFGEIYSCCSAASPPKKTEDYPNVVKIEPHGNGPLFVEMHFYARNCKKDDIESFRISRGWKHLGMPHLIGHGSQDIHGDRHRFLVMPRFGSDIWKLFLKNNRRLPQHTVYRIGIQVINVLEYMHHKGYVHADIKGANILLGMGKSGAEQCYLVDFGLACTIKDYKPDPKNAHNGTIEYTSRDAHNGVFTMRGDMEILGLNLVHWSGLELPWEAQKLLANPKKVQESKEQYMKNLDKHLGDAPEAIRSFMKYVERMGCDERPDYDKLRGYLEKGLKACGKDNKGPLECELKAGTVATPKKPPTTTPKKRTRDPSTSPVKKVKSPVAGSSRRITPAASLENGDSPESPKKRKVPAAKKASPAARKPSATETPKSKDDSSIIVLDSPTPTPSTDDVKKRTKERRAGQLVVNNDLTPKPATTKKARKAYEFNFELDVSLDADVVVNVKRKGRSATASNTKTPASPLVTQDRKRQLASESTNESSPISPVVRKRIARNVKVTPSGTVRVEKG